MKTGAFYLGPTTFGFPCYKSFIGIPQPYVGDGEMV